MNCGLGEEYARDCQAVKSDSVLLCVNTYILFGYYFMNKWCDCEPGCSFILSILDRSDGTKFGGSGGIWNFSNWFLIPKNLQT